jgi:hypothetical protein
MPDFSSRLAEVRADIAAIDRRNAHNAQELVKSISVSREMIVQSHTLIERCNRILANDKRWMK